jgi:hypothetical protein
LIFHAKVLKGPGVYPKEIELAYIVVVESIFVEMLEAVIKLVLTVLLIDTSPAKVALPVTERLARVVVLLVARVLFINVVPTVRVFNIALVTVLMLLNVADPAFRLLILAVFPTPSRSVLALHKTAKTVDMLYVETLHAVITFVLTLHALSI